MINEPVTSGWQSKFFFALGAAVLLSSCAHNHREEPCYLSSERFEGMKEVFIDSGSYVVTQNVMEEEQWLPCEMSQFRNQLQEVLGIEDAVADLVGNP